MYAISYDINTVHKDYTSNVYAQIKKILAKYGFNTREFSVLTSNCGLNELYLAIEELKKEPIIKKLIRKLSVFYALNGSDFSEVIKLK